MKTYIALFRGINIGGKNILPMKELTAILESLGLHNIRIYIQSGNAIFQSKTGNTSQLSTRIGAAIMKSHGFEPKILLLDSAELKQVINANPYPEAEAAPNTLHVIFLFSTPPSPDLDTLEKIKTESERFHLADDVLYLHAPDGVGRSKLASRMERLLGVPATGRNWRTVCKIMEMMGT